MMGTVWLRLSPEQDHIQPFINAIVSFPRNRLRKQRTELTSDIVLRLRIHVLHGSRLRPSLPRRPRYLYQGARERLIRRVAVHSVQFHYWTSLFMYVSLSLSLSLAPPPNIYTRYIYKMLIENSHHLRPNLHPHLLPQQLSTNSLRLLHLPHVALPGPSRRRVARSPRDVALPELRHRAGPRGVRQRPLDERGRVPRLAYHFEPVLEIRFPLY